MLCEHGNIAPCVECDIEPLRAENEKLVEALEKIRAIEDELYGGDWDEIEKARNIANEALATYRNQKDNNQ